MSKNWFEQGRAAFPSVEPETAREYGMSLRDWFAGQALIALVSQHDPDLGADRQTFLAEVAYRTADAMLKARES